MFFFCLFFFAQAPCCKKPYTCRLCHDEVEQHELDRKEVERIKCLNCSSYQQVRLSDT